jgi:hypothetical protein
MPNRAAFRPALAAAALLLAASPVRGDVLIEGTKSIQPRVIVQAGRFDDFTAHRFVVREGDTLGAIAKAAYGDPARAKDIQEANPGVVPEKLAVGSKLLLPPKLAPPADAKEQLVWRFYAYSPISGNPHPERVFPGERFDAPGKQSKLVAVPEPLAAEFERMCEQAKADRRMPDVDGKAPYALAAKDFHVDWSIDSDSDAVASTTTYEIVELRGGDAASALFRVKSVKTEYVDKVGKPVQAGLLAGAPALLLIAGMGLAGLLHLRRRRAARAA